MTTIPKRAKVAISPIYLRGPSQVEFAIKALRGVPLDSKNPIEVLIREKPKQRKLTLNAVYWAGPLADIARQAIHQGRHWTAEEWAEGAKALFLPDPDEPHLEPDQEWREGLFDPSHVLSPETYRKWSINPLTGDRTCVGSTTKLTDTGMRVYLLRLESYMADTFHVRFTTRDEPRGR